LVDLVDSLKKFALIMVLLVVVTFSVVFVFDQLIASQTTLSVLFRQTSRTVIVVVFGSIIILFIRRSKSLIARRVGAHPATIFQFFMLVIAIIVMIFAILHIFDVSPTALLVGGGVVSIIMGLVISTFAGNILAGTMVLMTNPYRVGDDVLVNNVPGKILEITAMTTRIRNYIGGEMVIPNNAIVQGVVIVTKMSAHETVSQSRLPYSLGDRVYTTYMSAEGLVTELTPFYTKIMLDSRRELTFLNNSVLVGSVAVAKVSPDLGDELKFSVKVDWNPRQVLKVIKDIAASHPETFKSVPTVLFSSLNGKTVELEVACKVDSAKRSEAKSLILEAAYLSGTKTQPRGTGDNSA
jgi:small-conductance mechanosensitive channel